jgi:chromosome partitioning protein
LRTRHGRPRAKEASRKATEAATPSVDLDEGVMRKVLVINTKGGVGKTTVTTNLASYFAATNVAAAIMDFDPQGSSINWLRQRPKTLKHIHAANAAPQTTGLHSFERYVPPKVEQLIVDAPAGSSALLQQDMLRGVNHIIIPVGPSAIDIHATAGFIKELLLRGRIRTRGIQAAVVANRARDSRPIYEPLERFVNSLGMPFLTRLRDSDVYVDAAESGVGIFEMDEDVSAKERQEFMPIVEWVTGVRGALESNVIDLASARASSGAG